MAHFGWSEGSVWDLLASEGGFVSNAVRLGTLRWAPDSAESDKERMLWSLTAPDVLVLTPNDYVTLSYT